MKKTYIYAFLVIGLMLSFSVVSALTINDGYMQGTTKAGHLRLRSLEWQCGTSSGSANWETGVGIDAGVYGKFISYDFAPYGPTHWGNVTPVTLTYDSSTGVLSTTIQNSDGVPTTVSYTISPTATPLNYMQLTSALKTGQISLTNIVLKHNGGATTDTFGPLTAVGPGNSTLTKDWYTIDGKLENGFTLTFDVVTSGLTQYTTNCERNKVDIRFGKYVPACTPSTEVCDGKDNDCDGSVDEGIVSTPTTCGVGGCASTGVLACVNGAMVDSCTPGTPSAEECNQIDDDCDGTVDDVDADSDTINDCTADQCLGSVADNIALNPNQYAQNDLTTSAFETGALNGQSLVYNMENTKGCSCKQIIEALGKGEGHAKKGCSPSVMEEWTGINAELDRSSKVGRRPGLTGAVIDFFSRLF